MKRYNPSDDAIAAAAAVLAAKLADIRMEGLQGRDAPTQEDQLMSYYRWAVDQLLQEYRA